MNFHEMMSQLKKNWVVSSILCIVAGLILLFFPVQVLDVICYVVGGIAIACGVTRMVRYFRQDHTYPVIFQSDLIVGLFTLGLGIFMVTNPQTIVGLIPTIFSIVLIGFGIANILRAVDAKKAGYGPWGVLLALAILTIILGYVILLNPFDALTTTIALIGGCLIYEGVSDLITVLLVGKKIDAWRSALNK